MKNVLSPISDAKMRERDAKKPDRESGTWKWLKVKTVTRERARMETTASVFLLSVLLLEAGAVWRSGWVGGEQGEGVREQRVGSEPGTSDVTTYHDPRRHRYSHWPSCDLCIACIGAIGASGPGSG